MYLGAMQEGLGVRRAPESRVMMDRFAAPWTSSRFPRVAASRAYRTLITGSHALLWRRTAMRNAYPSQPPMTVPASLSKLFLAHCPRIGLLMTMTVIAPHCD